MDNEGFGSKSDAVHGILLEVLRHPSFPNPPQGNKPKIGKELEHFTLSTKLNKKGANM